jgi:hypothetical protein
VVLGEEALHEEVRAGPDSFQQFIRVGEEDYAASAARIPVGFEDYGVGEGTREGGQRRARDGPQVGIEESAADVVKMRFWEQVCGQEFIEQTFVRKPERPIRGIKATFDERCKRLFGHGAGVGMSGQVITNAQGVQGEPGI